MSHPTPRIEVAAPLEVFESPSWQGPAPAISVVVSTHSRFIYLGGLLEALSTQLDVDFEVLIADNGSTDETWALLTACCAESAMRMKVIRLDFHNGPAVPRNTAIAMSRGPIIAITDDDCLPTETWLTALLNAMDAETVIVQGMTLPQPGGWAGPWGRTVQITQPTGLYETANLAVRRDAFDAVGGFSPDRMLSGRAFGEDVLLGAAIARNGGFRFADDALVHHRVLPGTYRDFIRERQRLAGFPLLLRRVPALRQRAFAWVFLTWRTAVTDLAVGLVIIHPLVWVLTSHSPWTYLTDLALIPWFFVLWREARNRPGRNRLVRAAQLACGDITGAASLFVGSLTARRLLL